MIRKAFIISPKKDQQNRIVLKKRFADVGLTPQFVDAVMGKELSESQKQDFQNSGRQFWLPFMIKDNAIGCALSHYKIWEYIANGDEEYGLICEDDAMPISETAQYILAILNQLTELDKPIDILFLANRSPQRKVMPIYALPSMSQEVEFQIVSIKYNSIGAECYLLSRNAARALLTNHYRYLFEVDCLLHHWWLHSCNVLHLDPPLFAQEGRPSTIGYTNTKPWPSDHIGHKLKRKWHRIYTSYMKRMRYARLLKHWRDRFASE